MNSLWRNPDELFLSYLSQESHNALPCGSPCTLEGALLDGGRLHDPSDTAARQSGTWQVVNEHERRRGELVAQAWLMASFPCRISLPGHVCCSSCPTRLEHRPPSATSQRNLLPGCSSKCCVIVCYIRPRGRTVSASSPVPLLAVRKTSWEDRVDVIYSATTS